MKFSQMLNLSSINIEYGQGEIDVNMEVVLINLLGKDLSAKDSKDMNLIVVSVSVLSSQF